MWIVYCRVWGEKVFFGLASPHFVIAETCKPDGFCATVWVGVIEVWGWVGGWMLTAGIGCGFVFTGEVIGGKLGSHGPCAVGATACWEEEGFLVKFRVVRGWVLVGKVTRCMVLVNRYRGI